MKRRAFLTNISALPLITIMPHKSNAAVWFWPLIRGLVGAGARKQGGRAVTGLVGKRAAQSGVARFNMGQASGRAAASVQTVVPYAVRNPQSGAKAVEILGVVLSSAGLLATLMSTSVQAKVRRSDSESPMMFTVAYYALLRENDLEAALAMWIDPDAYHFGQVGSIRGYRIDSIDTVYNDDTVATVKVGVFAQNNGESAKYYELEIYWVITPDGWRIAGQKSI